MTQTEILNSTRTKTWKIEQLLGLGLTRTEVARLMNCGYGFVQNVYARMNRIARVLETPNFCLTDFEFNHTFGVEIEAYGISMRELETEIHNAGINICSETYNHSTRTYWKIVPDGSLSGTNCFEIVSPKLQGLSGLRELKTVLLIVRGLEAKVNRTCGLHVHFDASNFALKTWKNILWNYIAIESTIDSFMPISRRAGENTYCKSLNINNSQTFLQNFNEAVSLESGLNALRSFYRHDRYFNINLQSFLRHHSIEFRQHSGTVNYKKVENWILFLARFIEFSKNSTFENNSDWNSLNRFLSNDLMNFYSQRRSEVA